MIYNYITQINFQNSLSDKENNKQNVISSNEINNIANNTKEDIMTNEKVVKNAIQGVKKTEWKIEIKAISLSATIAEGTTDSVMNKYVGHFENTSKKKGNIGLASHNRGYPVNYFENLKKLKKGDKIKYTYGNFKKTYIVDVIEIIEDTNWKCLENTEENRITLITCVENEPNLRRCIQGIEK